ncbi:hypothetical protein [Acuticoccus mangrovi]|uniref:YkuD domain-containing protein n=1 Tax=Acuticoccus mangrovi TaxID=2796142 RepID=A0A934IS71_9HYPH|nr:hypothetical protein [Acuticoccus mangrovi]MBJ3777710.1 hypothetical protein [Acuticoccus mangrovi]
MDLLLSRARLRATPRSTGTARALLRRALLLALILTAPAHAEAIDCPAAATDTLRLLLVVAPSMSSVAAEARLYERAAVEERWQPAGPPFAVVLGRAGLGWAWNEPHRGADEPQKREGDGRTPAGVFRAGPAFGTDRRELADYLPLRAGESACVDDVASPLYNEIAPLSRIDAASHEAMWRIPLYRQGIVVEHPTNREAAGGSCIFLHVWRGAGHGTLGCVAAPEADIVAVQDAFDGVPAAIAILPEAALPRFEGCGLPLPEAVTEPH